MSDFTIHVDYNPEHECMTFSDSCGEPILSYWEPKPPIELSARTRRSIVEMNARRGSSLPDVLIRRYGWVLHYVTEDTDFTKDGYVDGEYITDITELTAVDDAVAAAQEHLRRIGYPAIEDES